ncbi:hypothetical protein HAX54_037411 [Datura stramonium]|uniref:Uncharacterized protein n=1 Tax=Datura stramonium TaxID=4076 RepID=A0ABS8SGX1_DATST|nr:hypothetical protein [Datura stramonium]
MVLVTFTWRHGGSQKFSRRFLRWVISIFHLLLLFYDLRKCTLHVCCYVPTNAEDFGWCSWSEQILIIWWRFSRCFQRVVDLPPGYHKVGNRAAYGLKAYVHLEEA